MDSRNADRFGELQRFNADARTGALRFGAETGFQAGQNDAERGLRAAMTNQEAQLQANGQGLDAARSLAEMGGLRRQFAFGAAEAVGGWGAREQAQQQQLLDLLYGEYETERDWDLRGLGAINSTLGYVPVPKTVTEKGTKTTTKAEVQFSGGKKGSFSFGPPARS